MPDSLQTRSRVSFKFGDSLLKFELQIVATETILPASSRFGDSLVDNSNNKFIASLARANYPPNDVQNAPEPVPREAARGAS